MSDKNGDPDLFITMEDLEQILDAYNGLTNIPVRVIIEQIRACALNAAQVF